MTLQELNNYVTSLGYFLPFHMREDAERTLFDVVNKDDLLSYSKSRDILREAVLNLTLVDANGNVTDTSALVPPKIGKGYTMTQ